FNIRDGMYNEAISIPYIVGISNRNTITFEAESGDSNKVILTSHSSNPGTDSNYAIQFDSASYIIFNHLTISRSGSDFRCGVVEFIHNPSHITFENCSILGSKN